MGWGGRGREGSWACEPVWEPLTGYEAEPRRNSYARVWNSSDGGRRFFFCSSFGAVELFLFGPWWREGGSTRYVKLR